MEFVHLKRWLLREAKPLATTIGEIHQVSHIVVAASTDTRITEVELSHIAELT